MIKILKGKIGETETRVKFLEKKFEILKKLNTKSVMIKIYNNKEKYNGFYLLKI